jgi:hypothetical protein
MALYAAIGAEFKSSLMKEFDSLLDERIRSVITRTLKQVAHDYELSYKDLKARYCSKESLDTYDVPGNTQVVTVDLEPESFKEPEPVKVKEAKVVVSKSFMALSKMKKGDLVRECEERGLDSEGTVSQLKDRVKEARDKESPASSPKEKKSSAPKEKEKKAPAPKEKEKKAPAPKKSKVVVPPPPPVALEEEEEDEGAETEADEDICQRVDDDDEEFVDEDAEDAGGSIQERLRKLLAEANEEEEEEYDEDA